ncbi:DeoR family transcriptional regulator [Paenibacillus baekrokdamisoli]|uniref:DeoR family transcriptional regulator n=1 Tax=Paenibacillus baekrokdamisoli TaxID=1712516 RepID=A0A3G9ISM3_9BACL|nr:DeoR/GlpR family DNA-binding transcription regulator [Paenibacillus baekrokdamisoli]MBB3070362.1 DeoR/GlpR family transcriptional regulator of sugar metabolism [Paenibacillus baekrokdamisoli]BBH21366.1 DeoR family transcriptional regulator [Paenibacillus baekrokdamisoli]
MTHNQTINQRQQQILDRMALDGEVKIAELKDMFDVTEMTLRRDLEKLEYMGLLRRTFGGAILVGKDIALQDRTGLMMDEKMRIGLQAAQLVQSGDSIFLDGGSTTLQVARYLKPDLNITVVTNALNIAAELQGKQISTIVVGGMLLEKTATLVGPIAAGSIAKMAFDRVFIGATGVSFKHGFSNSNMHEAEIKRLVIEQASEVNIVMDHTKYGLRDLFSFASLNAVDRIISNSSPDQELEATLKEASVEIVLS